MTDDMLARPDTIVAGEDALFLDLDGTLAPLFPRPDDTILGITVRRVIIRLQRALQGRLAIISERNIATIDRIVGIPSLAVAGINGLERRVATGAVTRTVTGNGLTAARREHGALVAGPPRLLLEDKGASLALHYRMAPDLEASVRDAADRIASGHELEPQSGQMVVEVREPGPDKGSAVAAFMAEAPFHGSRPVFVGDDMTDEVGFAAAVRLGGHGVMVGQPRSTAASFRLDDVAAVEAWLLASAKRMEAA